MCISFRPWIFIAAAGLLAIPAYAVSTDTAIQSSYDHFEDGKLENIAIPAQGGLRLAPAMEPIAKLDAAVIWCAVADKDGTLYVGTGNNGKVFKVTPGGKVETIFEPGESLAHALALDTKGNLYVGTSPDGYVYRIVPGGRPEIYFHPEEKYIWDLKFDAKGNLFVATGSKGRIYRLAPDYKAGQPAEVYFETDRAHMLCLAFDNDGNLLAGAGPRSLLYRIADKNKATVLASPGGEEITGIQAAADGMVYFATFNKPSSSSSSTLPRSTSAATSGNATSSSSAPAPSSGNTSSSSSGSGSGESSTLGSASPAEPVGRYSQFYRVNAFGFVEPVWSLPRVGIYSFRALPDGRWLIGSDQHGRLFAATAMQDWELLQEATSSGEASTMLADPKDPAATFVFASNPAQIFRLSAKPAAQGVYICEPFDIDQPVRWGTLRTLAVPPMPTNPLAGAKWETRTGNTPKPDATWNDWQPIPDSTDIASRPGRYFQYRVTLTDPVVTIRQLSVYYQHFNAAPVVDRLGVLPVGVEVNTPSPLRPSVDLRQIMDSDQSALNPSSPRTQIRTTGDSGAYSAAWHATDPNGDDLLYTLQLRSVGDDKWVTLANDLADPVYSFSSRGFADGYYQVRVVASDKLSNPPGQARTAERVSTPFLINNTGPAVAVESQLGDATAFTVTLRAHSATTVLDHAQYILDGQPAKPALPEGNMFDKPELVFKLRLEGLKSGPHSMVFIVVDAANNSGSAKANFEVP
jgi:hypothetical protein